MKLQSEGTKKDYEPKTGKIKYFLGKLAEQ